MLIMLMIAPRKCIVVFVLLWFLLVNVSMIVTMITTRAIYILSSYIVGITSMIILTMIIPRIIVDSSTTVQDHYS